MLAERTFSLGFFYSSMYCSVIMGGIDVWDDFLNNLPINDIIGF